MSADKITRCYRIGWVVGEWKVAAAAMAAWRKWVLAAKKPLSFSHQPLVHTEDCVCVTFMSQMSRKMSVLRGNVVNVRRVISR